VLAFVWRGQGTGKAPLSDDYDIPSAARDLIQERIHSIEALEVVLALRERRERVVTAGDLSASLRISASSVESALSELCEGGLVACERGTARYQPSSGELESAVEALVQAYEHHRVEILVLISKNAIGRVRNDALRTFAEAFRVRKGKDDG
jgi:hypothetical protein